MEISNIKHTGTFGKIILGLTSVLLSVSSYAQSGYRVCAVHNDYIPFSYKGPNGGFSGSLFGRGLVVKVAKNNGGDTCAKKINFMYNNYTSAYPGAKAEFNTKMWACESFNAAMGAPSDVCSRMEVNKIYKFSSRYGQSAVSNPDISFWHN